MKIGQKIPPLLSFYGGKHRSAGRYPAPMYSTVVEPFAGSAGYAHRYWWNSVVLVERDPVLVAVWRYLIQATRDDILSLPLLTPDDDLRSMTQLSDAERWLIGFWVNKGAAAPRNRLSAWAVKFSDVSIYWGRAMRLRIADHVQCVNHWRVIDGSYELAPDRFATWFIDPPYQRAGVHYRFGSEGIDYAVLGDWCRTRLGQCIVCEQDGADWLPFTPLYEHIGAAKCGAERKRGVESVWLGGMTESQASRESA